MSPAVLALALFLGPWLAPLMGPGPLGQGVCSKQQPPCARTAAPACAPCVACCPTTAAAPCACKQPCAAPKVVMCPACCPAACDDGGKSVHVERLLLLAKFYLNTGHLNTAYALARQVVELAPENATGQTLLEEVNRRQAKTTRSRGVQTQNVIACPAEEAAASCARPATAPSRNGGVRTAASFQMVFPAGAGRTSITYIKANVKGKTIEEKLTSPISLNFRNTPLRRAVHDLQNLTGVNMVLDTAALAEEAVNVDAPISIEFKDAPLQTVITRMLEQVHLAPVIRDGMLVITTEQRSRGRLVQVTYPVADLVVPVEECLDRPAQGGKKTIEEQLIRLIASTVAPEQWAGAGSKCRLQYFPVGMGLVVTAPEDVQEQVVELLNALRRLQEVEVAVEVRFVDVSAVLAEEILAGRSAQVSARDTEASASLVVLDDDQVREVLEAAQGDRNCNVMQAPRVTVFNGQTAHLNVADQHAFATSVKLVEQGGELTLVPQSETLKVGTEMTILPVVSADRRFVKVGFQAKQTTLNGLTTVPVTAKLPAEEGQTGTKVVTFRLQKPRVETVSVKKVFTVADGKTVVLPAGKVLAETRSEPGPNPLASVPYVSRLFTNVGYGREARSMLILVTPRVIVTEAEELRYEAGRVRDAQRVPHPETHVRPVGYSHPVPRP